MTVSGSVPGAVAAGVVAGAAGTLAMDLVWYARYRRGGGKDLFSDWEFSTGVTSFDGAGPPAQLGRRIVQAVFHVELPPQSARTANNVMHWATGTQWGAVYALVTAATGKTGPRYGLVLGPAAWSASYVILPLAKVYKPIWEYDANTLAKDLSAHLVYGMATATVFRLLRR
jgi:hypothetical protein